MSAPLITYYTTWFVSSYNYGIIHSLSVTSHYIMFECYKPDNITLCLSVTSQITLYYVAGDIRVTSTNNMLFQLYDA